MAVNNSLYPMNVSLAIENDGSSSLENNRENSNYYVIDKDFMDVLYKVIIVGIIPPITVFGIVGNILALLILVRQKPIRSTTILLISIAIADLGFLGVTIINNTQVIIRRFFPEINREVQFKLMIPYNVYFSPLPARISNFLVTAVTLERLIAVTCPLKVKKVCTKKIATVITIVLSITAALMLLPRIWLYEIKEITLPDGNVTSIVTLGALGKLSQFFEIYYITSEALLMYVPIGIMVIANSIIIGIICVQAKWRRKKSSDVRKMSNESEEFQITKTLLTITCIFIVCLTPSTVSRTVVLFDPNNTHHTYSSNVFSLLTIIGQLTETFNSSINFIIYVSMSKNYRAAFYKICGRTAKGKRYAASSIFKPDEGVESKSCSTTASSLVNVSGEDTHM